MYFRVILVVLIGFITSSVVHGATDRRSISVSGSCLRAVTPDRGTVTVTAEILDRDPGKSAKEASAQYEKLREAVRNLNLPDLEMQTSEYSVREVREWQNNREVSRGFRARMGLKVSTSNIQRLGEVLAAASRLGVRDVGMLATYLSDAKRKVEREACLSEAVKNAQAKATTMASAAGGRPGRVLQMTESPDPQEEGPIIMETFSAKAAMSDMPAPAVESRPETISVRVSVQFELN